MPNPKKRAEKQEAASSKKNAAESAKKAEIEEADWSKGAKGSSKAEKEAEKKAEQARKREEKARLEAEENASLPSKPARGAEKSASKKANKIENFLASAGIEKKAPALSATNIDDALDALTISNKSAKNVSTADVDRHPERRFKAAYAAFEERRIQEMKAEKSGLRLQQMKDVAYKEFQKSPENPFNQLTAEHNATREELQDIARSEREKNENRLARK